VLSFLAALTGKIRLVTSITVIPHRGAVETAKLVATIDVLSHGRMTLGVGAGWMREEFEALGAPPFDQRGRVTDEYLRAFKILWTEDDPAFEGEFVRFQNISFLPKPRQKPYPPIWIGGESGPALRRAARYGDTWYPIGNNPRYPLGSIGQFVSAVRRLGEIATEENRDPASISLVYCALWFDETKTLTLDDGSRQLLSGTVEQIAEDVAALAESGVQGLMLNFQRDTLEQSLDSMQYFADVIGSAM
jgi:probable F420-dependent oxidoreductase